MINVPEEKEGDIELLIEIVKFENDKEGMKAFETVGWSWRHIRMWPATLDRLMRLGFLDRKLYSESYKGYRLSDKGRLRIYDTNPQRSEGQIEQDVLEARIANVRRNTAKDIFEAIDNMGNFKVVELGFSVYQIAYGDYITLKQKYGVGL